MFLLKLGISIFSVNLLTYKLDTILMFNCTFLNEVDVDVLTVHVCVYVLLNNNKKKM